MSRAPRSPIEMRGPIARPDEPVPRARLPKALAWLLLAAVLAALSGPAAAVPDNPRLANERCLRCHGKADYSRKAEDGTKRDLHVDGRCELRLRRPESLELDDLPRFGAGRAWRSIGHPPGLYPFEIEN